MGWVTLTLRKTELKRTHADYQNQLLQISREKRQMARQNHYDQSVVRNNGNADLKSLFVGYQQAISNAMDGINASYTEDADGNKVADKQKYDAAQHVYAEVKNQYEQNKLEVQQDMEDELARLEQEANDIETQYDQEQVQVEAQLEAISAEIEAVGQAISSQIQASTIKLS